MGVSGIGAGGLGKVFKYHYSQTSGFTEPASVCVGNMWSSWFC